MTSDKRHAQQREIFDLILEYGESRAALSEKILGLLEDAWDRGCSTGRYDALYRDTEYWEDLNPYREDENGE